MIVALSQLSSFIHESVNPRELMESQLTSHDFDNWANFVGQKTAEINLMLDDLMANSPTASTNRVIYKIFHTLTSLSDRVFGYLFDPELQVAGYGGKVRDLYRMTCRKIEELLSLFYWHPTCSAVQITRFALAEVKMELRKLSNQAGAILNQIGDSELASLVTRFFEQYQRKNGMSRDHYRYIVTILNAVIDLKSNSIPDILHTLIGANLKTPEFFVYCVNRWRRNLSDIADLHQQIEFVITERQTILMFASFQANVFPRQKTIYDELQAYLSEQQSYLKQLLKLKKSTLRDEAFQKLSNRFPINLSVPQFGLFIRLQIEKGILQSEHLGQLFKFFADHFYTANANFISAANLQKKSTDVDFSTAQKLKGELIGMLNWLNTNFNLSNYK